MIKHINKLLLLSAIAILAACEKSMPPMPDSNEDAISFGVEWQQDSNNQWEDSKTRAAQTDDNNIADFGVFTYYELGGAFDAATSTPNYMNNIEVSKSGTEWSYSPLKYWPAVGSLSFFAYSPYNQNRLTINTTAGKPQFKYSLPVNIKAQRDLLISTPRIDLTIADLPTDGKTLITFQHALSCLDITGSVASVMKDPVKITNIKITGLKRDGEFTFTNAHALQSSLPTTNENIVYTINEDKEALNVIDIKDKTEPLSLLTDNGYPMIIPQNVEDEAEIEVTYTSGNPVKEITITKKLNELISEFESGKRYTVNIKLATVLVDVTITATAQPWTTTTVDVPSFN